MGMEEHEMAGGAVSQIKTKPVHRTTGTCAVDIPGPCGLVIFGASGDLTKRKILPSLYRLQKNRLLPEKFFVLGTSRTEHEYRSVPWRGALSGERGIPEGFR